MTGRVFGFELLAQQVGDRVASKVHHFSTTDWRTGGLFGGVVGTTPIEKLFAYALEAYHEYIQQKDAGLLLFYSPGTFKLAELEHEQASLTTFVDQQVELGGWRVDFVIYRYCYFSRGPDMFEGWSSLVVECDGHDYHERTKEDAARDRSRDRAAMIGGIPLMRFTGSELWNDPIGCIEEVMQWFALSVPPNAKPVPKRTDNEA